MDERENIPAKLTEQGLATTTERRVSLVGRGMVAVLANKQLNSGFAPEVMQAGITLTGYHVEKGARTFAAYAKAMIADLGDAVKPYLKSWYLAVKHDPRGATFIRDMTGAGEVEDADIEKILGESNGTDQCSIKNLERDSGNSEIADGVGEEGIHTG